MSSHQTAEHIHSQLSHPVIDSDGHWIEFEPAAMDYLKEVGGDSVVERYTKVANQFGNKKWAGPLRRGAQGPAYAPAGLVGGADQEYA